MFVCQTVNSDRFLETLFCTRSFTSLLRYGSLNMLLTLPVEKGCVGKAKPHVPGTKPVTLFYWMKAKVYPKCCYVLCLTKESLNTATLVHASVCVCVYHARRTEVWVIPVRLKYEVEAGPDFEKRCSRYTAARLQFLSDREWSSLGGRTWLGALFLLLRQGRRWSHSSVECVPHAFFLLSFPCAVIWMYSEPLWN